MVWMVILGSLRGLPRGLPRYQRQGCQRYLASLLRGVFITEINLKKIMGSGADRNNPCPCGNGEKYKNCCMGKMETRKCPRCKKDNQIAEEARKFQCGHCGAYLSKVDRPSVVEVLKTTDDLDSHLNQRVLQNFLTMNFLDTALSDQEGQGKFMQRQVNALRSLMKANKHLRCYRRDEVTEMERLGKANAESGTTSYIASIESIELEAEWDAYLVQLKSALDTFAGGLGILVDVPFHGWHSDTDRATGRKRSGIKILNALKNIGTPSPEIEAMVSFLEANMEWVTRIVELRDKPVHHGQSVGSGIHFNPELSTTHKAKIIHDKNQSEDIATFMERTLKDMSSFFRMLTYLGINHRLDKGFKMGVDKDDNFIIVFPSV